MERRTRVMGAITPARFDSNNGWPFLLMVGENGQSSAMLQVSETIHSGLSIADKRGNARILLTVGEDDSNSLSLFDKANNPRGVFILDTDGTPSAVPLDKDGKRRWGPL